LARDLAALEEAADRSLAKAEPLLAKSASPRLRRSSSTVEMSSPS
jgi:hypothetical protein